MGISNDLIENNRCDDRRSLEGCEKPIQEHVAHHSILVIEGYSHKSSLIIK